MEIKYRNKWWRERSRRLWNDNYHEKGLQRMTVHVLSEYKNQEVPKEIIRKSFFHIIP